MRMSVSELKEYLQRHGESIRGVREVSELRRRVWECYVESLGAEELTDFIRVNNISAVGCENIRSKREALKKAFRAAPIPKAPSGTWTVSSARDLTENQGVTLTGLQTSRLNGKTGKVLVPEAVPGRAEIKVDRETEPLRIQFKNLRIGDGRRVSAAREVD